MEIYFEKIEEAIRINNQIKQLNKQKEELLAPALTDTGMINRVLELVIDMYVHSPDVNRKNYTLRDHFILVSALLYCPQVFTGQVFNRGLRITIGKALGLSPTHVSGCIRRIWYWCRQYQDFRKGVWMMYNRILDEFGLEEEGVKSVC